VFSEDAVDAIHFYTSGVPRLINLLCDRVLLRGYLQKSRAVERPMVESCEHELYGQFEAADGRERAPGHGQRRA
jgi:general secretion pathway protein A